MVEAHSRRPRCDQTTAVHSQVRSADLAGPPAPSAIAGPIAIGVRLLACACCEQPSNTGSRTPHSARNFDARIRFSPRRRKDTTI